MKRSFLDAFKTSLDLGSQLDDITIKRMSKGNNKQIQDVIYHKNRGGNSARTEFEEDYENEPIYCDRASTYSYQEEILRKANQIEEQETEDEFDHERQATFGEIQENLIFGDRSNIQNFNQRVSPCKKESLEQSVSKRRIFKRIVGRKKIFKNKKVNLDENGTESAKKNTEIVENRIQENPPKNDNSKNSAGSNNTDLKSQLLGLQSMFMEAMKAKILSSEESKAGSQDQSGKADFLNACSQKLVEEVFKAVQSQNQSNIQKLKTKNSIFTKAFKFQKKVTQKVEAKLETAEKKLTVTQTELAKIKGERDQLFHQLVQIAKQQQNSIVHKPHKFDDDENDGGDQGGFGMGGWNRNVGTF